MKQIKQQNKKYRYRLNLIFITVFLLGLVIAMSGLQTVVYGESNIVDNQGNLKLIKKEQSTESSSEVVPVEGAGFAIYKIMDFQLDNTTHGSNYIVETAYQKFFKENQLIATDFSGYQTSQLERLIDKLTKYIQVETIKADKTAISAKNGIVDFNQIDTGYYLVVETTAPIGYVITSKPFLVSIPQTDKIALNQWNYDITVPLKNAKLAIDKKIETVIGDSEKDTVGVGEKIHYRIDAKVIKYPENAKDIRFAIKDTMSPGLTLLSENPNEIQVYKRVSGKEQRLSLGKDYIIMLKGEKKLTPNTNFEIEEQATFGVYFKYNMISDAEEISVKYIAQLNENAVIGSVGNINSAQLEYSNTPESGWDYTPGEVPGVPGEPDEEDINEPEISPPIPITPEKTTAVYVFGLDVLKIDLEDSSKKLSGAYFGLYNDKECTELTKLFKMNESGELIGIEGDNPAITEKDTGLAKFYGLKSGTYYLKELVAPEGYQKLNNIIKLEISIDEDQLALPHTPNATLKVIAKADGQLLEVIGKEGDKDGLGYVQLTLKNRQSFAIPETSGIANPVFLIFGTIITGIGIYLWKQS